jgi:hypothetical protein
VGTTKKRVSILEGLATEILALSGTAGPRSTASRNLTQEIESLARRDYGLPLRKSLGRREVLEIVAEARSMVWPHLNREPLRLVTPREFTRLWSSLGVDFRLANFGGPRGLALMGFYARKMGPSRRPLIYVNTAHHPAAVGAVFSHEMGHHLTAKIFASQKEHSPYLSYTAFADHLDDPAELAADCLVSLGVFPEDTAREMFEVESGPSERVEPVEPAFARVRNYIQSHYGFNLDARLPAHKKLPYLAGMIHYANLRRALLHEYGI